MSSPPTRWIECWGRDRRIYAAQGDQVSTCIHYRAMDLYCQSCADQHFEQVVRETLERSQAWNHTNACYAENNARLGRGEYPSCICGRTL